MRKFLVDINNGKEYEIVPLTYKEFLTIGLWTSSSDTDYKQWKYANKFVEGDDFREEALKHFRLELRPGEPNMLFMSDSEEEYGVYNKPYNKEQSFKEQAKFNVGCTTLKINPMEDEDA